MKKRIEKILLLFFTASLVISSTSYFACGAELEKGNNTVEEVKEEQLEEYAPDDFSWSGGTGRVEITCDKLVVKDGVTYGEIVFSSDSYTYVKVGDETYYALSNDECSVFEIPVEVNTNIEISAMTTRMSEAHEIKYQLYIGYGNSQHELVETIEPSEAKLFKIYKYSDGSHILEIQRKEDVQRVYFVPEGVTVPAGTEKEMTVVNLPVEHVFYGTEEELDYKKLVENGTNLIITPSENLSEEVLEKLELLGIPVIYDCSDREESEEAKAEWEIMFSDMELPVFVENNESGETEVALDENAPVFDGLSCVSKIDLKYAQCFDIYKYASNESEKPQYSLIDVHDVARYFVVEEDAKIPENLESDIVVLQKPLDHIYLAATSVMSLFDSLDALSNIRLSGTDISGWYIENAVKKMESGDILYAGKYSEPDYELLLSEGCDLAIESTMIQHTPKVKEMIEDLGIPVIVDYSSYESHPLGRTEWIKLYSVLTGKEEEGKVFFDKQAEVINRMEGFENTEKTVVFFYVSTDGKVVVRSTGDYIPKMIEIAGGRYPFENLESTQGKQSSVSMTMEEFYNTAVDADYLIYNASIDSPVETIEELMTKSELFADFKAVKEGNVWGTGKYLYQATDVVGNMIEDIHLMLTNGDEKDMTFIFKIK